MSKNLKLFVLFFIFILTSNIALSQNNIDVKKDINLKIEYTNNLILHYNVNARNLKNFQNELVAWAANPNRSISDMPRFQFWPYLLGKSKLNLSDKASNDMFNYNFHLFKIESQISEFISNCKKLETSTNTSKTSIEEEKYLNEVFQILNTMEMLSLIFAETCYDFSRACAVNYKAEEYPVELAKIKNVVSQAKNLILALRENNAKITKEYLDLISAALQINSSVNLSELSLNAKTKVDIRTLELLTAEINAKASNITNISKKVLNSNLSKKESSNLLEKAITEFNESEGKTGCASSFNTILKLTHSELMLFMEEPLYIFAEKIILNTKNPQATTTNIAIAQEAKKEVFDAKNKNSLVGSLPNNLIILLDVSVSMKKSQKLPILKESISHFLNIMRAEDKISLIAYSGKSQVLVSGGSKNEQQAIIDTLNKVSSSGGSDLYSALKEAYRIGEENFIKNGNNKIIIASDGIFGVDFNILKLVSEKAKKQYSLSVFHYSAPKEQINIKLLQNLANTGKGSYRVIYDNQQAIEAMMLEIKKQDFTK